MKTVDLNSDLGESFGPWVMGHDAEMIELATSVNIACGYHAGDADVMRKTVELAKARGVSIGAHPGYRDLHGFGRRPMPGLKPKTRGRLRVSRWRSRMCSASKVCPPPLDQKSCRATARPITPRSSNAC